MSKFKSFSEIAKSVGRITPEIDRPIVCIQGLGFVGAPMAAAVANACDPAGSPFFNVIGVDLPTSEGMARIDSINRGELPFRSADPKLSLAMGKVHSLVNLIATFDPEVYSLAETVVVDINFDITFDSVAPSLAIDSFRAAIKTLGEFMQPGCLVIIETTIPPGTCEKVVIPELSKSLDKRGLSIDSIHIAHSYERVMPGKNYYDSIVNFWRVYSGNTPAASKACEAFLSKIINTKDYPLTCLSSLTASEVGKILENSYRAVNIAFIEEWGRFAEQIGIDLYEVIEAIRVRPTHSNIRQPGFGVGGYCLPKDPLLGLLSAKELYHMDDLEFPFCSLATNINRRMPLTTLEKIREAFDGELSGKKIVLLGVSYLEDVGDTRFSPSQVFVEKARELGAHVKWHDPLVDFWPELSEKPVEVFPSLEDADAVVFAVGHKEYKELDFNNCLNGAKPLIVDANNVLSKEQRVDIGSNGCRFISIGRGE
jgi:nucleotide sugar dehydrogenase